MEEQVLLEKVTALGARQAALIPVERIPFDRKFRALCETNACGNYGGCWTCPPDAGDIDGLIQEAQEFSWALVYQTVGQLEDSFDVEGMAEAARVHSQLAQAVLDWGRTLPLARQLHLGAGGCRLCPVCARRTEEPCRHPDRALASLETYGIHVAGLAEACGMKYIHGPNTVTYFGAMLFCL